MIRASWSERCKPSSADARGSPRRGARMKVIVLGAGVAGLTTAWFLRADGHEVTVIEKNLGVALDTSYANGGQLSYSYVAPLASPGVLPKIPPWLLRRDAPLRFYPKLDLDQWQWCVEFVRACNATQADLTTRRLLALSFYSRTLLRALVATERIAFDYVQNGKLVVHAAEDSFEAARRLLDYQASLGCEQQALDAEGCVALEPALAHLRPRIAGGIFTPSEDAGDCYEFCKELERLMTAGERPVRFVFGCEVKRIARLGEAILGVETSHGVLEADRYVLALGAQAPLLVRPLGIRLPIYPLKGYSFTVAIADDRKAPRVSVTDYKRKVVYARLGDELRIAGMADLAGYTAEIAEDRVATLLAQVQDTFPGCSDFRALKPWSGLRPATPKGTPIIGRTMYRQLLLNSGHGALGFTLSMGCARVIADLVAGKAPAIPLEGMTL
jgi:D-amino-acid dehydrogenase